jgi:hypothetical protein
MLRRQVSVLLGFLLLAGGLGYGLVQLFNLRMESGDVFPAYSTLRADPVGTKVLMESLSAMPGLTVWRNYQPLVRLKPAAPVTLVYAGQSHRAHWEEKELRHFESLITSGSRAVFAFAPVEAVDPSYDIYVQRDKDRTEKLKRDAAKKRGKTRREIEELIEKQEGIPFSKVADKWGFKFEVPRRGKREPRPDFTALGRGEAYGLEPALPWHSELHFGVVKPPWKTLYSMAGHPVVIERPWGAGSIILASDSYFLSNEALYGKDRAPKLLVRVLGSLKSIVFDEEHLGVAEQSGISTLAKKYRLHGFVAGLLLVAALFIWQNIVRFVPPQAEAVELDALVTGRGSSEGFLVLLRRSVPAGQLLQTCVAEWRRTFAQDQRAVERLNAVSPSVPPRKAPEIVAVYGAMARAVISKQNSVLSQPAPTETPKPLAAAAPLN